MQQLRCPEVVCSRRFEPNRSGWLALVEHLPSSHGLTVAKIIGNSLADAKVQRTRSTSRDVREQGTRAYEPRGVGGEGLERAA